MFRLQHIAPSIIGPGLRLRGELSFERGVIVGGTVQGAIATSGCVHLTATGSVSGAVRADAMVIEAGGRFEGKVTIGEATGLLPREEKGGPFRRRRTA